MRVLAYTRVSTSEQADSGLGLAVQRAAIEGEATRRGWVVEWIEDAGYSGSSLTRPGLSRALGRLRRGDVLVVAKLDRLSRSLVDFVSVMAQSRQGGWSLVCLDLGVDTTTPHGEMVANVLASFAQFERRLISQRTRDALAQAKARGVRLGGPRLVSDELRGQIVRWRGEGLSLAAIADQLNTDQVPTVKGGVRWYPSTVHGVLRSATLDLVKET